MPIKPVPIAGFKGMNNIKAFTQALEEPRIILNAYVKPDGKVVKRKGYTRVISLNTGHSLTAISKYMILVDGSTLYQSDGIGSVNIGSIGVPPEHLTYAEINGVAYMSNSVWNGALDLATDTLRTWGIPLPEQPVLSTGAGNLPPGRYLICFTITSNNRLSGNSPVAEITLSIEGGIVISNIPVNGIVWITEPNGSQFFYAGSISSIIDLPSQTDILPSLWCEPPPFMENVAIGLGRIWGSVGEFVYYSMPLSYEWFRLSTDFFYFPKEVTTIAPVTGGVYVGFADETIFLSGKSVNEMTTVRVGDGIIKGSLAFADNFGDYKNSSLSMLGNLDAGIPIWMGRSGIYAGMHNGTVIELTSRRIRYEAGKKAAALFHMLNGEPQYLVGTPQGSNVVGFGDTVTCEVIRNGRVFLGDYEDSPRDWLGFAEEVSATII